jgi:hypothetical protein
MLKLKPSIYIIDNIPIYMNNYQVTKQASFFAFARAQVSPFTRPSQTPEKPWKWRGTKFCVPPSLSSQVERSINSHATKVFRRSTNAFRNN